MEPELTPKQLLFCNEYLIDMNATRSAIAAGYDLEVCAPGYKGYYVYLLVDGRNNQIFYIGKGKNTRYADHVKDAKRNPMHINAIKGTRINDILKSDAEIKHYFFAKGLDESEAFNVEKLLLDKIGSQSLTNIASGYFSRQEREKIDAQYKLDRIIPFAYWRDKKIRTAYEIELYWKIKDAYQILARGESI